MAKVIFHTRVESTSASVIGRDYTVRVVETDSDADVLRHERHEVIKTFQRDWSVPVGQSMPFSDALEWAKRYADGLVRI